MQRRRTIAIGADHAGYELKDEVGALARAARATRCSTSGTNGPESVDYPDFAAARRASGAATVVHGAAWSCAARAPVRASRRTSCAASARRSRTTPTARTRRSSTTTPTCCAWARASSARRSPRRSSLAWAGADSRGEERHQRRLDKVLAIEAGELHATGRTRRMSDAASTRLDSSSHELGQAPWLDSISRDWLDSGELDAMRDRLALRGRDQQPVDLPGGAAQRRLRRRRAARSPTRGSTTAPIFHRLAIDDIRDACDVFADGPRRATGDGYVSIEVDPDLAHDTEAHDRAGARAVDARRPPQPDGQDPGDGGRPAGDRAGRAPRASASTSRCCSTSGCTRGCARRGCAASTRLHAEGGDVAERRERRVVLRQPRRHEGRRAARRARHGRGCGSCAARPPSRTRSLAWARRAATHEDPRWAPLAAAGAQPQRLLWASTGTKDPATRT